MGRCWSASSVFPRLGQQHKHWPLWGWKLGLLFPEGAGHPPWAPLHRLKSDHVRVREIRGYCTRQLLTVNKFRGFIRLVVFCQHKVMKLDMLRKIYFPSSFPLSRSLPLLIPSFSPSFLPFCSCLLFLPSSLLFYSLYLSHPLPPLKNCITSNIDLCISFTIVQMFACRWVQC